MNLSDGVVFGGHKESLPFCAVCVSLSVWWGRLQMSIFAPSMLHAVRLHHAPGVIEAATSSCMEHTYDLQMHQFSSCRSAFSLSTAGSAEHVSEDRTMCDNRAGCVSIFATFRCLLAAASMTLISREVDEKIIFTIRRDLGVTPGLQL